MHAAEGESRGVETHFQTIAESDEGIARQPLSPFDTFQQESRPKGRQLQIGRYRRVEIGRDVERRLHVFKLQISRAIKNPPPALRRRWVLDTDELIKMTGQRPLLKRECATTKPCEGCV